MSERIEDLQCQGLKIIQDSDLYAFTSDSVILANFIKTKSKDVVVEIGAGSGVISILVQAKNKLKKIYAFEIQECMQKICKKNIELNDLSQNIELISDDIKNFDKYLQKPVDVVFSNPPYFNTTNFEQSDVNKIAKEETCLTCEQLVECASKMLKFGGVFYVCYSAERSCELISNCCKYALESKEMFFTENGKGKTKLFVLKAVKGGKHGVEVLPNLITNDKDGKYLEDLHTKNIKN